MTTDYHAKFFAHKLTMTDNETNRLDRVLFDASVDLNPHQIEAALFALKSPLSQGVLLADEVGLGKTVEAGLVLCQSWAERRRSILIVCPASLRKQWEFELREKFNLPVAILDTKTHKEICSKGSNPWKCGKVIVCSYDFCAKHGDIIKQSGWDLVVIDEAHRLRNVWQNSNKMAAAICRATKGYKKILLTATPLQNKLEDLYGLSTLIDDQLFGNVEAFREQYKKMQGFEDLRQRLSKFCKRTLRSDVQEFIKFTNRKLFTTEFTPTDKEHNLYEKVSNFLQKDQAYSLPRRQKHLITLTVRKQLASSPHAIIKTLEAMRNRLNMLASKELSRREAEDMLLDEHDFDPDLLQAYSEDQEDFFEEHTEEGSTTDHEEEFNPKQLKLEIEELNSCLKLLQDITVDTKLSHLKNALQTGFAEMRKLGAQRKAVVFTESRRTQEYLERFLIKEGYGGKIVLFNGVNTNPSSIDFYNKWLIKNQTKGRITGSKGIDIRTALIETFRDDAEILIATEAAAEGINLQFCSLVINYDLPWNPQRIEQRIGRCHRYGQEHDVVVINFLNKRNHADMRVHELLSEKFNLFSGVFGVSDEVLGAIVSGMDFEKRILEIYQTCRTPQAIELALAKLKEEMKEPLNEKLAETRRQLLENFDYDIHSKFKYSLDDTRDRLGHMEKIFWSLSKHLLKEKAIFNDDGLFFRLMNSPMPEVANGTYHLIQKIKITFQMIFYTG
jgi:SNF2 family DNA or RNA helicase